MSNIRLSERHGLNPSLGCCWICGEEDGTVVIPGRLRDDQEAPRRAVWSQDARCPSCAEKALQGIFLIEVKGRYRTCDYRDQERTGRLAVVREEALQRMLDPNTFESLKRLRVAFISEEIWKELGLPEN